MDTQEQLRQEADGSGGLREQAAEEARSRLAEHLDPEEPVSSLEDMRVSRDPDTDQVEPKKVRTLWEGHVIRFLPMTYRDRNKYRLDRRGLIELNDSERVEFLSEHVVDPEGFAELETAEDLNQFGWTTIDDLLMTIQLFSRDRRRDDLPRPVSENGGKADPGA